MTAQNTTRTDYPNTGAGFPNPPGVAANHVDPYGRAIRGELALVPNTQSVTATLTLLAGDPAVQFLTPTAARTVTLPPVAGVCTFWIINLATVQGRDLTINDASAVLVGYVPAKGSAMLVSDGATWTIRYHSPAPMVSVFRGNDVPAEITTAGAGSPSAANIMTGTIVRDCTGASRTDTLPTAALLLAALALIKVPAIGDCIDFLYVNGSDPITEIITVAPGSGGAYVTANATASQIIPGGASKLFRIRFTNVTASSEAYTLS